MREESSFCEQKEAKKLCQLGDRKPSRFMLGTNRIKVFCFFFSKKKSLAS